MTLLHHAQTTQTARHVPLIVCVAAVAVVFTASRLQAVYAHDTEAPPVPTELEVPEGNKVFREGHAVGTQNYICLPSGADFVWTFFGPQATLFNMYPVGRHRPEGLRALHGRLLLLQSHQTPVGRPSSIGLERNRPTAPTRLPLSVPTRGKYRPLPP
jgi:hypothetical protein